MKISVVIPAYNHSKYLLEAINSAQNSIGCETEIIVVNDGSTDDSESVALSFPNVRYFAQVNQGAHSAINFGVKSASNQLIAILNDDDIYSPEYLQDAIKTKVFTGADIVATSPTLLGFGPKMESQMRHREEAERLIEESGIGASLFKINWFVSTSGLVFSKDFFNKVGGFQDLKLCHDLQFVLSGISKEGFTLARNQGATWYYRCHGFNSSSSISMRIGRQEILEVLMDAINYFGFSDLNSTMIQKLIGHGISDEDIDHALKLRNKLTHEL